MTTHDMFFFNGVEYSDVNQIIDVLKKTNRPVIESEIPTSDSWKRSFWSQYGVEWFRADNDQYINHLRKTRKQIFANVDGITERILTNGIVNPLVKDRISLSKWNLLKAIDTTDKDSFVIDSYGTEITHDQLIELIDQIATDFTEIFEARNNALSAIRKAGTTTELNSLYKQFVRQLKKFA